ncbi:MAG: sulfur carrier protein ThiS adenylyltransferase ThiF [Candidatus Syntrophopropionicum ammoniitolerans]
MGSNCALHLVRSGFKKLRIIDFDLVEYSNLNRQFYFVAQVGRKKVEALEENLLLVNTDLAIEALSEKIREDNVMDYITGCDAVVEALDNVYSKTTLVEACLDSKKPLVAASGLAGWGNSDGIKIHCIKNNFYIVGDLVSGAGPACPQLTPGVNVAAAMQADILLGYFLKQPLEPKKT